jgi:hypothetical protein
MPDGLVSRCLTMRTAKAPVATIQKPPEGDQNRDIGQAENRCRGGPTAIWAADCN